MSGKKDSKLVQAITKLSVEDKLIVFLPFLYALIGGLFGLFLAFVVSILNYKIVKKYERESQKKYFASLLMFLLSAFVFGILLSLLKTFMAEMVTK